MDCFIMPAYKICLKKLLPLNQFKTYPKLPEFLLIGNQEWDQATKLEYPRSMGIRLQT
jgi:hypothetical protein